MARLIVIIAILLLILITRFYFFYREPVVYTNGQKVVLQTTLLTQPTQAGSYQRITARLPDGQRVFITTGSYPEYEYGQQLQIQGTLEYKTVAERTIYTMSYPQIAIVQNTNPLIPLVAPVRSRIIDLFATSLPQPGGTLLLGIVFGIEEDMPKNFAAALQTAGVLHVIAASGMNVTIIGGFLASVFGRVVKRQYALVITILGIIFYAGLAGFSPSIVRASIMGMLVFSAQIIGRQNLALYGLFLAGFSMLMYQPFLLFDTGFQLSFMATWGLIVFNPLMQLLSQRREWIIVLLAKTEFFTTFIAQLVTLPILLGTFGTYSLASVVVNMLVLWTIPILMIIGGIGTLVGLVVPLLGKWIMYLSLPFLLYFESIVWLFAKTLGITIQTLSWQSILGYYFVLIATAWILRTKTTQIEMGKQKEGKIDDKKG